MQTLVLKKKSIVILLISLIIISSIISFTTITTSTPKLDYTILIDAGHGGIDGGCVGKTTGKDENFLNLEYAKTLKSIFEKFNFKVIMTRTTLDGLYDITSNNKKKSDMEKRKNIILQSKPNVVLSLHMNSFPLKSSRGAQVFYKKNDVSSQSLATSIQEIFLKNLPMAKSTPQTGDYYILNCSNIPSVIVECGFLSNADEERLLITDDYKNSVCYSIFLGFLNFLSKS